MFQHFNCENNEKKWFVNLARLLVTSTTDDIGFLKEVLVKLKIKRIAKSEAQTFQS